MLSFAHYYKKIFLYTLKFNKKNAQKSFSYIFPCFKTIILTPVLDIALMLCPA